jgi:hypothetical protein
MGRFANGAYQIAGTIGIATKSGQPYGFPKWINHDAKERFGSTEDIEVYNWFVNPLPEIIEGVHYEDIPYFWGYRNLDLPTGNWNLNSHFQSPKYFEHCMPLIRETFRMKDEPKPNDWIAIHYRAGDYQEGPDCHHPRCSIEYYNEARKQFPDTNQFLLFSDDVRGAVELFNSNGWKFDSSQVQDTNYLQDFAVMKSCKSFITANSSFSAFAALLGEHPEKKIVMPSRWFGSAWGDGYKEMPKDIYPENAIVV